MTAPRLAAAKLMLRNRRTRTGVKAGAMLLSLAVLIALFCAEARAALPLEWLRLHGPLCAGLAAIASALMIARRRALKRAEFARSWLAAVPVSAATARWESLFIEMLPALAAIGLLSIAAISDTLVLLIAGSAAIFAPFAAWAYLSGGIALGMIGSFFVPQPKPPDLPPGSRYVPHQNAKRSAELRPSLRALGSWPIRQAFAWAQPRIVARATIPILVIMPLGTTADSAMVVIGMFAIVGMLVLVCSGVISASRSARRWLAPLPVRPGEAIRALLLPACAVIAAASASEALLLLVMNVPYRTSVAAGTWTAAAACATLSGCLICSWARGPRTRR